MLSPPDVQTSTILVLSGSGVPGPTPALALPSPPPLLPEKHRRPPHVASHVGGLHAATGVSGSAC